MNRKIARNLGVVLVVGMIGCAHGTPVANVAAPSTQVEQTGSAILQAAQTAHGQINPLTNAPIISTQQLDTVALACDKIGRIGTTLAQALTDYSSARSAGTSTTALAASIQSLVNDATAALAELVRAACGAGEEPAEPVFIA